MSPKSAAAGQCDIFFYLPRAPGHTGTPVSPKHWSGIDWCWWEGSPLNTRRRCWSSSLGTCSPGRDSLGGPTSPRSFVVGWDLSGRETPARLVQGRWSWEEGWARSPEGRPALRRHSLLLLSGDESERLRAGTFWGSGVSCVEGGMAAHKVFCPQKWSLDGKFENPWPGSLRVSRDAPLILGLAVQTLPFLVGAAAAAPGLGLAREAVPRATLHRVSETLSSGGWGALADLLGGGAVGG